MDATFRAVSCVSMLCSCSVVITCAAFYSMRNSFFTRNILMIAFCDVFVGVAGFIGIPGDGTTNCVVQAFLSTFFVRGNWLWTTVLICQMYKFVTRDGNFFSEGKVHAVVWITTSLMTFVPLANGSFGRNGLNTNTEMCFIKSSSPSWVAAWVVVDWLSTVFGCITIMAALISSVLFRYRSLRNDEAAAKILKLTRSLYVYPLVLTTTWGTNSVINVFILITEKKGRLSGTDNTVLSVSSIFAMTNGTFLAIVFYMKSYEARYQWRKTLCCLADTRGRIAVQSSGNQTTPSTPSPVGTLSTMLSLGGSRITNFDFDETSERLSHLMAPVFMEARNSSLHESINSVL
jgi:hypothetical protein